MATAFAFNEISNQGFISDQASVVGFLLIGTLPILPILKSWDKGKYLPGYMGGAAIGMLTLNALA